jgi:hypothetical protein
MQHINVNLGIPKINILLAETFVKQCAAGTPAPDNARRGMMIGTEPVQRL